MPGLLRPREGRDAGKVGTVELFFDLVFVYAVTQLSHALLANLNPPGAVQVLLLFMAVWWVWVFTSWVTNWLDPERVPVRLLLFALMAAGLLLSISIPHAFDRYGLLFACAYAAMQVGRSLFALLAVRRHDRGNFLNFCRITLWLSVSALLWITGGLADGEARLAFWAAALAIEFAGPMAFFYVPGLGRSTEDDWEIDGAHLAERCGLFIIIALGESILITGRTFEDIGFNAATLTGFAAAFIGTVGMWWVYFNIGAERASHHIARRSSNTGRLARTAYTYMHLPIVGGIIITAAADELVLAHPFGHDGHTDWPTALALIGGPAVFLLGNAVFKTMTGGRLPTRYKLFGRWPVISLTGGHMPLSHFVGLLLLAAAAAAVPWLVPLWLSYLTSAILIIVAAWESRSLNRSEAAT